MLRAFQCNCVCLAIIAVVIGCASTATAELIPNGAFNTDLSGWVQSGDTGGWGWYNAAATGSPGGSAALFVNGPTNTWLRHPGCTLSSGFVAGQAYELQFIASGAGPSVGTIMQVELTTGSGVHSADITLTGSYQPYRLAFTATTADVGQPFEPGVPRHRWFDNGDRQC